MYYSHYSLIFMYNLCEQMHTAVSGNKSPLKFFDINQDIPQDTLTSTVHPSVRCHCPMHQVNSFRHFNTAQNGSSIYI